MDPFCRSRTKIFDDVERIIIREKRFFQLRHYSSALEVTADGAKLGLFFFSTKNPIDTSQLENCGVSPN